MSNYLVLDTGYDVEWFLDKIIMKWHNISAIHEIHSHISQKFMMMRLEAPFHFFSTPTIYCHIVIVKKITFVLLAIVILDSCRNTILDFEWIHEKVMPSCIMHIMTSLHNNSKTRTFEWIVDCNGEKLKLNNGTIYNS